VSTYDAVAKLGAFPGKHKLNFKWQRNAMLDM
jgi:hypothetical protein